MNENADLTVGCLPEWLGLDRPWFVESRGVVTWFGDEAGATAFARGGVGQ